MSCGIIADGGESVNTEEKHFFFIWGMGVAFGVALDEVDFCLIDGGGCRGLGGLLCSMLLSAGRGLASPTLALVEGYYRL